MELAGVTDISLRSTSGNRATRTQQRFGFDFKGNGCPAAAAAVCPLMRSKLTRHFRICMHS